MSSKIRIFSYLPNPRVWKSLITAKFANVDVEVIGDKPKNLANWLWDYDAKALSDDEKSVLVTTSDKEGKFIISKDKLKNSFVVISHSNFKDLKVSYENLKLNKTIKLDKKIYYFDPIFVIGNKYNFESNNLPVKHIVINSVDFPSHGNSLGDRKSGV